MLINELTTLEDIERIELAYMKKHGAKPTNVSMWDPSDDFKRKLEGTLRLPPIGDAVDYAFTYTLDCHSKIVLKLGFTPQGRTCLLTPTGSTSLLCAIKRIKDKGYKRIVALAPHYFTLEYLAKSVGLELERLHLERIGSRYFARDISLVEGDVLWITNPIYCAGVYYSEDEIALFERILESGFEIIADECLAKSGFELSRRLGGYHGFTGLYCPHKTICMNGMKFSCIICSQDDIRYYDQWSDVLYGCLGMSNTAAINHYLSDNFKEYDAVFESTINSSWEEIVSSIKMVPGVSYDYHSYGYLRLLLFPDISPIVLSGDGLGRCIKTCGASFIPSTRNHCSEKWGMGFRINLAADSPIFRGALQRLLSTLSRL